MPQDSARFTNLGLCDLLTNRDWELVSFQFGRRHTVDAFCLLCDAMAFSLKISDAFADVGRIPTVLQNYCDFNHALSA